MVNPILINPIYLIGIGLGTAFFIGFLRKAKNAAWVLMLLASAGLLFISFEWLRAFVFHGRETVQVFTAGAKPPFSINLQMGREEAFFTLMINAAGLFGGFYLFDRLKKTGSHAMSVFIVLIMGLNGMVLTRDIFNLFVFMEIATIATAGMIVLTREDRPLAAGFKYMIAAGIISGFLLLGIIFVYYFGGTLNIDVLQGAGLTAVKGGLLALFMIVIALLLELKPFPANGWAIDVYDAAPAGIGTIISAASTAAAYFVLVKVLPLANGAFLNVITVAGLVTFAGSNLMGIKQDRAKRLLGYSSIGQMGLLLVVLGLSNILGDKRDFIAAGLILTHYFAKAVLFWLAGIIKAEKLRAWAAIRRSPVLLVLFGAAVFALIGFPPFPSFFAKWELVMLLMKGNMYLYTGLILAATFLEAVYLFRWFGYALKLDNEELPEYSVPAVKVIPPVLFGILLFGAGYYFSTFVEGFSSFYYLPIAAIAVMALLDWLPGWIKNTLSIGAVAAYIYFLYPQVQGDLFRMIFGGIFLGGALLTLISSYWRRGKQPGFYPMTLAMFAGLAALIQATTLLEFFFGWELMTIGSYFLLIRGKKSMPHGYRYLLFSIGGSFAMMFGFGLAFVSAETISLSALSNITVLPMLAYSLMILGFMTKTATIPMHIWLPGAHGEAKAEVSVMASAILLKAGVFGLVLVLLGMGSGASYARPILSALTWVGAVSAIVGNVAAAFQESSKRLLAWSSIGQLGYIVFGLATMTHLGWLLAMTYTVAHFIYKAVLFFVIGGIALRTGSTKMYEMGGLIKRMPFSFIAVLISIIALSGVPPLVGFAAKWLTYNLMITEGFYLQIIIMLIAGITAFLYLFRLIYTVFLGQLKDNLRTVKEISFWFLLPVYILLAGIMYLSMKPSALLRPVGTMLTKYFPDNALIWSGDLASTGAGYFNGPMILYAIGAIFMVVLLFFFANKKRNQKVKQFNIFYSGHAPSRPELSHFSYNFFAHYKKALGAAVVPYFERFWDWLAKLLHGLSDFFRRIYNGNGQSYAFHLIIYTVVVFLIQLGGRQLGGLP